MLTALKAELTRSMEHLKNLPAPPYFLSYEVYDGEQASAAASHAPVANCVSII